jgi:P-type Mg2+ transporter
MRRISGGSYQFSPGAGISNLGSLSGTLVPEMSAVEPHEYWAIDEDMLLRRLDSSRDGLPALEAARRLRTYGPNRIRERARLTRARVLLNQLRNPLLLVLVFAAGASALTGEWVDAAIVLVIVVATVGIGYAREFHAQTAAAALQARVQSRTRIIRDGQEVTVPTEQVVVGDVVVLSAGSVVPADAVLLEAADFFVNEAVLTGESFPVQKRPGTVSASTALRDRLNCVLLGTNVRDDGWSRGSRSTPQCD